MAEPTIRQLRFRKLLRIFHDNGAGLSQQAIADKLGISQTLVAQVLLENKQGGEESIAKAKKALDLHEDWFSAEEIGTFTWKDFVGATPLRETRVDLDSDVGTRGVEAYLAELDADGTPATREHAKELRGARFYGGDAAREVIEAMHRGLIRRDKRVAEQQPAVSARKSKKG